MRFTLVVLETHTQIQSEYKNRSDYELKTLIPISLVCSCSLKKSPKFSILRRRLRMIVSQNMVAEAEIICQQSRALPVLDVKYRRVQIDVGSPPSSSPSFGEVCVSETISTEISRFESVVRCSETITNAVLETSAVKFAPKIHSGSHSDIGVRRSMDDDHIRIDDLSALVGRLFKLSLPSAFYAVFDGHGGPEAATYIKRNAMRLFFEDSDLPQTIDIDASFFEELENSHKKAFLLADQALADEHSVSSSCGTTALTALVLGRHLLVANAGDCRAVLCRKGVAFDMSQDHKPSYLPERRRVEELGGYIDDGYLNGYLSVTRTLGNWDFKLPLGSSSPLIAEPDVKQIMLTEDDEFLILSCDGIWDVMSSQYAVSLVRRELRKHNDPQQCARELVKEALRLHASDNLTVIVVCLSSPDRAVESRSQGPRLRNCSFSKLRSLLEDN